jgi:hypothetical protein
MSVRPDRGSSPRRQRQLSSFFWIWIFNLAACSHAVHVDTTLAHLPEVAPLPIKVGLHYPAGFAVKTITDEPHGGDTPKFSVDKYTFNVGEATIDLFDQACRHMFADVVEVREFPSLAETCRLDAILVPDMESLDVTYIGGFDQIHRVTVRYRISVHDPGGATIDEWVLIASAVQRHGGTFTPQREAAIAARLAMVDAIDQFMNGFRERQRIKAWLSQTGKSTNIEDEPTRIFNFPSKIRMPDQ